jgi:hypothetical protein
MGSVPHFSGGCGGCGRNKLADAALEATLPLPEKDRPVLAAAIRHGCAALVTGDRSHCGKLYGKMLHGVAIHSPRSLAEALLK